LSEGLRRKDYEAWVVVGLWRDRQTGEKRVYVLEAIQHKGHLPDWSVATFLQLRKVWRPIVLKAETVNYQRTLKWLLEQAMMQQGAWTRIDAHQPERRKKAYRIIDTLGSSLAQGQLYFHRSQRELIEQIFSYPSVQFDDLIEALSVAVDAVLEFGAGYSGDEDDYLEAERDIPELPDMRACP
jgi:predicted phage terminase large subunit-like protein